MYTHNNKHSNTDTVQLEAPEYNLDIDSNNNDTHQNPLGEMASTNQTSDYKQNISNIIDANSPEPDTMHSRDNIPETNWPDTPTVQIPRISSTTTDVPSEVEYHKRTTVYTAHEEDIPELEEDEDQQEYINNHHLITHHNTHQEGERIRREYTERL